MDIPRIKSLFSKKVRYSVALFAKLWAYLKHGPEKVQEFERQYKTKRSSKVSKRVSRKRRRR